MNNETATRQTSLTQPPLLYVGTQLPEWANDKQLEGVKKFTTIAKEYGDFDISFKPHIRGNAWA